MANFGPTRSRTLHAIVAALGGDLYAGGLRANVPAPGHGPADRSISLLAAGDRLVAHSFGGASWREVLDDLRRRGLIDAGNRLTGAPAGPGSPPSPPLRSERIAAAQRLWSEASPLRPETPAARHCQGRGIGLDLAALCGLRGHDAAPASVYRPGSRRFPALLAAVCDAGGGSTAVEITYLTESGQRRRMALARKAAGVLPAGSAVRLLPPAAQMLVAEGVFTALSAIQLFGLPGWALLSAHNLARWTPPPGVRRVLIAADNDAAGEAAAARLQASLWQAGLDAEVRRPPVGCGDWNDVLRPPASGDTAARGLRPPGRP